MTAPIVPINEIEIIYENVVDCLLLTHGVRESQLIDIPLHQLTSLSCKEKEKKSLFFPPLKGASMADKAVPAVIE